MSGREYQLSDVRAVYAVWGRHPRWYVAQDVFSFMGRHREIRRSAVEALGVEPGDRVLEIGCGNGRNLENLRKAVGPGGSVVAFDVTPEMLATARREVERAEWANVQLRLADAATIELPDASFDAALAVMSFSAMPRFELALQRAREALKPGGVLVVADAQNFSGRLGVLNPLLENVVAPLGTWHPRRDLPDAMFDEFGNVSVRRYNFGTFYVARSMR